MTECNVCNLLKDKNKYKGFIIEVSIYVTILIIAGFISIEFDVFETLHDFTRKYEETELDEIITVGFLLFLFSFIVTARYSYKLYTTCAQLHESEEKLRKQEITKAEREKMACLGEMAGGMSHEINNSLQPILGLTEVLKMNITDKEQLTYLGLINDSAIHARKIVQNVLSFARKEEMKKEYLDLIDVLNESVKFAAEIIIPSSINVSYKGFSNEHKKTFGFIDKTSIAQVLVNIFSNATYSIYEADAKGLIEVSLDEQDIEKSSAEKMGIKTGKYVTLSISDNGTGIEESAISKVFNPFYTSKPVGEGTGLGLSTCYGIIREMEGAIVAKNNEEQGANFTLFLPIKEENKKCQTC
jgi:signal transduction histidine kinase